MKNFKPIATIVIGLSVLFIESDAQSYKIENVRKICCESLALTKPVWDTDGSSLLLTGEHNRGLYIFNIQQQQLRCLDKNIKIKSKPQWLKNGEIVYLKGKDFGFVESLKSADKKSSDTLLTINTRKQKIEAIRISDNSTWEITPEKALYYNPLISPDGKLVVVHLKSEMYLYAIDGSGLIKHLGTGLASSWSPDSKFIIYFLDESSDGHSISNSELYIISSNGQFKQKITETPGLTEMWPAVSPDGKQVAFSDDKTGRIFIADLIQTRE